MANTTCSTDRDYERIFVRNRQIDVAHFYAINWTEDSELPIKFAFGYWTHDGIFLQGVVGYSHATGAFGQPQIQQR